MTLAGTSGISTQPEIAVRTHYYAQHGPKTTPLFPPTDREASWSLLTTECHKRENLLLSLVDKAVKILQTDWLRRTAIFELFRTNLTKEQKTKFNFEVSVKIFIQIYRFLINFGGRHQCVNYSYVAPSGSFSI